MYWGGKRIIHKKFGKGTVIADTISDKLVKFDIKPPKNEGIYLCNPNHKDYEYLRWIDKKDFKQLKELEEKEVE